MWQRDDLEQLASKLGIWLIFMSICNSIQAQNSPSGFLTINCGGPSFVDPVTTLTWDSDDKYTFTGINGIIPANATIIRSIDNYEALQTFRYFPHDGHSKHCYDLYTTRNNISFLLRAMFLHANSIELRLPINFDVYVNNTKWINVDYPLGDTEVDGVKMDEAIFFSPGTLTHFCLKPNFGSPFISSLELRELDFPISKFPEDPYDRLWKSPGYWSERKYTIENITTINGRVTPSTSAQANNVPWQVMQDAWVNGSEFWVNFNVSPYNLVYGAVYVEEIELLAPAVRSFTIDLNGNQTVDFSASTNAGMQVFSDFAISGPNLHTNFTLTALPNSPKGPILNAIEVLTQVAFDSSATEAQDVSALTDLQNSFNLTDWQGDPCYPVSWNWVGCTVDNPARVDALQVNHSFHVILLSNMNITASIPASISNLDSLTTIQLANNSLYGSIPESLASLPSLTQLLLNNNNLSGEVPSDLVTKLGSNLDTADNPLLTPASRAANGIKKDLIIGVSVGVGVPVIAAAVAVWVLWRKRVSWNHVNEEAHLDLEEPPPGVTKLNDHVYQFYAPETGVPSEVDIIFFHGIQMKNSKNIFWKTWFIDEQKMLWPQTLLGEKTFPKARILAVSYDYSASNTPGVEGNDLYALGENLVGDIINLLWSESAPRPPVVLVGHSLGGILIKSFLLKAFSDKNFASDSLKGNLTRLKSFLEKYLCGIFLYSTPHQGTNLSEYMLQGNRDVLQSLKILGTKPSRRNAEFMNLVDILQIPTFSIMESLPTDLRNLGVDFNAVVVPEASGRMGLGFTAHKDHFNVCKHSQTNDSSFMYLVQFIAKGVYDKLGITLTRSQDGASSSQT
ncbi:unnamed protein product [Calypogeia fissa]